MNYKMKKILYLIITFISFMFISEVEASGLSTSISGTKTIYAGNQFTITLNATGGTNIMGITAKLNYDTSKLQFVSAAGKNGFTPTVAANVVVDNTVGKSGTFSFVSLTFKATSTFTVGQTTTISISNVNGSDGEKDIPGTGSSINISVVTPKSGDNNLSNLMINGNNIAGFSASKTSYSMIVDNSVTAINLSAFASHSKATVSGTGTKTLKVYNNNFNVTVRAENGTSKTYTINIIRKDEKGRTVPMATNNNLKKLVIEGFDITFDPKILVYELNVDNNISNLNINAEAEDDKANLKINNIDELKVNLNMITIEVKAENGDIKTYTIKVNRSAEGPVTTLDEILDIIPKTTSKVINVIIDDENTNLTDAILKELKINNINVIVNKYDNNNKMIYSWNIISKNINNIDNINTYITFDPNKRTKIDELTNYAEGVYLNFLHDGALPKDTKITIYVGDKYKDNSVLKLYYYNEKDNNMELISDEVTVKSGYVELNLNHSSDYFLSKAVINDSNNSLPWVIVVFEGLIIAASLIYIYIRKI